MGEILGELQSMFEIRPELRIDFASQGGQLHSGRVLAALRKYQIDASIETISALFEHVEKTPPTGAKMVDALIAQIIAASEGQPEPAQRPASFAGCELCHDGVVVLPFPGGNRAVYCDCGRGQFFWGANSQNAACLVNRPDLKAKAFEIRRNEIARSGSTLIQLGVDPEADVETQQKQWRAKFYRMRHGVGRQAHQVQALEMAGAPSW